MISVWVPVAFLLIMFALYALRRTRHWIEQADAFDRHMSSVCGMQDWHQRERELRNAEEPQQ